MWKIIGKSVAIFILFFGLHAHAQISLQDLKFASQVFHQEFDSEISKQQAVFVINNPPTPSTPDFWWNLDTVRSAYSTHAEDGIRKHFLFVLGGYARIPGMTLDNVVATLCHELGHGIAGAPFKAGEDLPRSVEGQADYFAYGTCLRRTLKRIPSRLPLLPINSYTDGLCKNAYKDREGYDFCTRAFQILEVERIYFKQESLGEFNYNTPDSSVAPETNLEGAFYPSAQCRIDTMMAGILKRPRPACWFKN